jgi:capsular polysaccharide biosynthesis protein
MRYIHDVMAVEPPKPASDLRVFLCRPRGSTRNLENIESIQDMLSDFGFASVDTSGMSVAEQIEIFSNTRYLVAMHGAGMVNMLFRYGAPLGVLELHSDAYVSEDMKMMARGAGWYFDRMAGRAVEGDPQQAGYSVDVDALVTKVEALLACA